MIHGVGRDARRLDRAPEGRMGTLAAARRLRVAFEMEVELAIGLRETGHGAWEA